MDLHDIKQSKFLTKEDVGNGVLATVKKLTEENVAVEGADPQMKITVWFEELEKPLVLNMTNASVIAAVAKSETDIENTWVGAKVVLYTDPTVQYKGKVTGGIRVRPPRDTTVQALPF